MQRFPTDFVADFDSLLRWRRDVRRFSAEPVDPALLMELLAICDLAPSVGLSQPWRFVVVESAMRRERVAANFRRANAAALADQGAERAGLYATLKLAGLDTAPVQIGVFCESDPAQGHALGRATMPETVAYSAVMAVHTLWLRARAEGLGLGWVSILEPAPMNADLGVPAHWRFIAYLCLGYPDDRSDTPELERAGWERRSDHAPRILRR